MREEGVREVCTLCGADVLAPAGGWWLDSCQGNWHTARRSIPADPGWQHMRIPKERFGLYAVRMVDPPYGTFQLIESDSLLGAAEQAAHWFGDGFPGKDVPDTAWDVFEVTAMTRVRNIKFTHKPSPVHPVLLDPGRMG